jgi:phenylacetate-coenzyme A ligase PaaK-like adenylate-forming protein
VLSGPLSPAVRVAAAARDLGLDIRGTLFFALGETITDAKRALIESTGAEVFSWYGIGELGTLGHGCRQMRHGNCVHVYRDVVAAINWRRPARLSETEVDSLLLTTLLPFSPLVLINAEMDDAGVVEPASCDCRLRAAGLIEQIRDLGSFGKLTGHGMTLVGTNVIELLERALPARLGGGPGDYQLVEHEGAAQTQLTLRISPRTGVTSPEKVEACFLEEVRKLYGGALSSRTWQHAGAVRAVIAEPLATASGKVLPLHLMRSSQRV